MIRVRRRGSGQPRPGVHTEALVAAVVAWWASIQEKEALIGS